MLVPIQNKEIFIAGLPIFLTQLMVFPWLGSQDMCLRGEKYPDVVYRQEMTKISSRVTISLYEDAGLGKKVGPQAT